MRPPNENKRGKEKKQNTHPPTPTHGDMKIEKEINKSRERYADTCILFLQTHQPRQSALPDLIIADSAQQGVAK